MECEYAMDQTEMFSPVVIGCSRHVSSAAPGVRMSVPRAVRWYELELITEADRGGVWLDGRFEPALPGRLFIRKPGMEVVGVHSYCSMSVVFDVIYDAHLQNSYAQHHYAPSTEEEQAYLRARQTHFSFLQQLPSVMDLQSPALLEQLFRQCLDWQIRRDGQAFFHQRAVLYRLLAAVLEENQNRRTDDRSPSGMAVSAVRGWLDGHYAQHVTLEMLAREAGMSREYLCRLFRARFGQPPLRYLTGVRLMHARRLLIDTDDTVESVASQCGFENLGHFYSCFKAHEGLTPARYRSQNRYPYSLQNG